jgi:PPOX class probable F420-dependent enzyme
MEATAMQRRLAEARVARLATVDAHGKPHLVPISFAMDGETLYFAIDAKPKRTTNLKRLRNIAANPSVCVLVDHYEDDWSRLWWVRVDGTARVVDDHAQAKHALDVLASRYPQYQREPPAGPVVAISIIRMSGWSAAQVGTNPAR